MNIRQLSSRAAGFDEELTRLLTFEETADEKLEATVASILADVKKSGDAAVLGYNARFDRPPPGREEWWGGPPPPNGWADTRRVCPALRFLTAYIFLIAPIS